jgi:hypothetical protein
MNEAIGNGQQNRTLGESIFPFENILPMGKRTVELHKRPTADFLENQSWVLISSLQMGILISR